MINKHTKQIEKTLEAAAKGDSTLQPLQVIVECANEGAAIYVLGRKRKISGYTTREYKKVQGNGQNFYLCCTSKKYFLNVQGSDITPDDVFEDSLLDVLRYACIDKKIDGIIFNPLEDRVLVMSREYLDQLSW